MNWFVRVPVTVRLLVVASFVVASIIAGIVGRPSRMLLLVAVLLFTGGAWRISKARSLVLVLILVPAAVALLMTHFDWHHPFLTRYAAGLFSVIAALLIMDGIRIEEWVRLLHRERRVSLRGIEPILIGTAVGTISLSSNIREQRNCRKLARIQAWGTKSRASIFMDSIALPFYNAVESHEFIDEALRRWSTYNGDLKPSSGTPAGRFPELVFGNSNFVARLSDLNDFPFFNDLQAAVFSASPIPEPWKRTIDRVSKPATVLEIGDYSGKFAKYLTEKGLRVCSLTSLALDRGLHSLLQPDFRLNKMERSPVDKPILECDYIFFHHDSFLDAVDQAGLPQLLTRIHQFSRADALICFEYPAVVLPMAQGTIFSGCVKNLGQVDYRYSDHRQDRGNHQVHLDYNAGQGRDSVCIRTPLRFIGPDLSEVIAVATDIGFACTASLMADAFSFLGETISFVELQRPDC